MSGAYWRPVEPEAAVVSSLDISMYGQARAARICTGRKGVRKGTVLAAGRGDEDGVGSGRSAQLCR